MEDCSKDEQVRRCIIEASQKLFQRFGLSKVTIKDISKAACKGRSSLYYYYKNKEEIFDAVIVKESTELLTSLQKSIDKAQTAEEKLICYNSTKICLVKEKANLYSIIRGELQDTPHVLKNKIKHFDQYETKMVCDILLMGIKNGEFKGIQTEDAKFVAHVFCTTLDSLKEDLLLEDLNTDHSARIKLLSHMLIKALK